MVGTRLITTQIWQLETFYELLPMVNLTTPLPLPTPQMPIKSQLLFSLCSWRHDLDKKLWLAHKLHIDNHVCFVKIHVTTWICHSALLPSL